MGMNVNGPNNVFGTGQVNKAEAVTKSEFINTVFGDNNKFVPNTKFNSEEQHILGLFANVQNNILIED